MSRMLTSSIVLGVWSLAVWSGTPALAQAPPGNAQVREPRPQNANLQIQQLPKELEALLQAWSQNNAKIQKLQGEHHRHVYDLVFNVEKRSMGVFYYEAPGKGRIDLKPAPIRNGEVSGKIDKAAGKPFKLQADRAEKWICDGKVIWQVNDVAKQVDVYAIPAENQGQNIMDGPMPFLFGMPPDKAKMRYVLTLIEETPQMAMIKVLPRWQVDAVNWREAQIILDKKLYLPTAVKLIDPAGNQETVYRFEKFEVNKPDVGWLQKVFGVDPDPFRPKLRGYTFKVHNAGEQSPPDKPVVPSVAGLGWNDAKELLENLDCKVTIFAGQQAPQGPLSHTVYQQDPAPKTPLKAGMEVKLTIYQLPPGCVPPVKGFFWKNAGAMLEKAGYKVKYLAGQVPTNPDDLYEVYEQAPAGGQPLQAGGEVTLTVFNKAQSAMK